SSLDVRRSPGHEAEGPERSTSGLAQQAREPTAVTALPGPSGAIAADRLPVAFLAEPAAVMHQEAHRAGELVGLLRHHLDREVLAGQSGKIRTRKLEALCGRVLVDVHHARLGLVAARLQLLQRVLGQLVGFTAARSV